MCFNVTYQSAGVICSMDPIYNNHSMSSQVIPLSTVVSVPSTAPSTMDPSNLPPPPPLIPISEVLQVCNNSTITSFADILIYLIIVN